MQTHTIPTPIQVVRRTAPAPNAKLRWAVADVGALFELPFNDLIFRAQQVHREHFDPNQVQLSTLLSIKTGGCEEDCGYCPQSVHYNTGVEASKLLEPAAVAAAARAALVSCPESSSAGPRSDDIAPAGPRSWTSRQSCARPGATLPRGRRVLPWRVPWRTYGTGH